MIFWIGKWKMEMKAMGMKKIQWIFFSKEVYSWPPTTRPRSANLMKTTLQMKLSRKVLK